MEIEVYGLETGLMVLALGVALMGYFIGNGLKNMGKQEKRNAFSYFIKESDLAYYVNLDKHEMKDLLKKYPDAPKIELNGTTYYPYRQFMDWISSIDSQR